MNESLRQLPFSYCGLLDDVVAKYYIDFRTEDLFNKIIAKSMFFGGGLYINDGYLLMNPVARQQMRDEQSLLSAMLDFGFVKIFTRCMTIEQLINLPEEDPGQKKPDSHIEFSKTPEWKEFKKTTWIPIVTSAWEKDHIVPWGKPRNHKIQTALLRRVLQYSPEAIGLRCSRETLSSVLERFLSFDPYDGAARTKFENACFEVLAGIGGASEELRRLMRQLMGIANEAYHYAFGASLTYQQGSSVAADTTISAAFNEFIGRPEIEFRSFNDIPLFGIPSSADLTKGRGFEELLRFDGEGYQAKARFIGELQRVLASGDWNDKIDESLDGYIAQLSALLNIPKDQFKRDDRSKSIALVKDAPGNAYSAVASSIAGLSVQVVSQSVESLRSQFARYTVLDIERAKEFDFTINDVVPQTTSLALHIDFVNSILKDPFYSNDEKFTEHTPRLDIPRSDNGSSDDSNSDEFT